MKAFTRRGGEQAAEELEQVAQLLAGDSQLVNGLGRRLRREAAARASAPSPRRARCARPRPRRSAGRRSRRSLVAFGLEKAAPVRASAAGSGSSRGLRADCPCAACRRSLQVSGRAGARSPRTDAGSSAWWSRRPSRCTSRSRSGPVNRPSQANSPANRRVAASSKHARDLAQTGARPPYRDPEVVEELGIEVRPESLPRWPASSPTARRGCALTARSARASGSRRSAEPARVVARLPVDRGERQIELRIRPRRQPEILLEEAPHFVRRPARTPSSG